MGSNLSRTWYIYSRNADDKWSETPVASTLAREDDIHYHIGRFKHVVFQMALKRLDSVQKVYLYRGWRIAKAHRDHNCLELEFYNEEYANAWWDAEEQPVDTGGTFTRAFARIWTYRDEPGGRFIRYDFQARD